MHIALHHTSCLLYITVLCMHCSIRYVIWFCFIWYTIHILYVVYIYRYIIYCASAYIYIYINSVPTRVLILFTLSWISWSEEKLLKRFCSKDIPLEEASKPCLGKNFACCGSKISRRPWVYNRRAAGSISTRYFHSSRHDSRRAFSCSFMISES